MQPLLLATSLSLLAASPAHAEKFLDGAYSNKEGCIYAKTGESSGADVFFLLTDKGVTTATAVCEFTSTATGTKTGLTIKTQCDAEGELDPIDTMTLTKSPKGYAIGMTDGTRWGPLPKCK